MENKELTKEELDKIIKESADEFAKKVIEEADNINDEENKKIDRILEIKDPTERMKEMQKLYPDIDGIGFC